MSKAGLTAILSVIIFITSGLANKTYAQELSKLPETVVSNDSHCSSPLTQKLVILSANCGPKLTFQKENSIKIKTQITNHEFSYAVEPTNYIPSPMIFDTPKKVETTPAPIISQAPTDNLPADQSQSLNSDLIFDLTNAHRVSIGKIAFQKDAALCELAKTRSTELHGELFEGKGALHSGLYNRNLPYLVVENAKYGSNEAGTLKWWLNSPVHRASIENDYVYSCVACVGTQCSQLFTSYNPRYRGNIAAANSAKN